MIGGGIHTTVHIRSRPQARTDRERPLPIDALGASRGKHNKRRAISHGILESKRAKGGWTYNGTVSNTDMEETGGCGSFEDRRSHSYAEVSATCVL